jgi:hypothetical protein
MASRETPRALAVEIIKGLDLSAGQLGAIEALDRHLIVRRCCLAFWYTAMRRECFRAASGTYGDGLAIFKGCTVALFRAFVQTAPKM